jgi:RNase P/RNase MRP subunit POP5
VTKLFGEYGASQAALVLIEYNETEKLAIIRTWHRTLEMVRTALATITKVNGKNAAFRVIMVSGTLKTLRRKIHSIPIP